MTREQARELANECMLDAATVDKNYSVHTQGPMAAAMFVVRGFDMVIEECEKRPQESTKVPDQRLKA